MTSLFDAVGRCLVSHPANHFITPFQGEFTHLQSSLGCVDNYVKQQLFPSFGELDVFGITSEGPSLLL
jgi:hypothetical protein